MIRVSLGAAALLLLPRALALQDVAGPQPPPSPRAPAPVAVLRGTVAPRTTLEKLLGRALPPAAICGLVDAARPAYNLARLSVGHPFDLSIGPGGLVSAFTYGIDELRTLRVTRRGGTLAAEVLEKRYESRTKTVSGVVATSLFAAVTDTGEDDTLALDLADVFAWDVDFHTEVRKGDSFRAAVETLYLDGRFARNGKILAAEFRRGPRLLRAVLFDDGGNPGYYAPDGASLRKEFLRSPLKYTRISSGFSHARLHPILGIVTPHLGIDYAAPAGTPVLASADGVVDLAGWYGGFGQAVRLRHANGYETLYGHLSRIDVRPGVRVLQGSVLGAVGATGQATGPHLDYRMTRRGAFVNPLTVELPPAEPVAPGERAAFAVVRDRGIALLEPTVASQAARAALEASAAGSPPLQP